MGEIDGLSRQFATSFDDVCSPITAEFARELDPLFRLDVIHIFDTLTSILPLLTNIRKIHSPLSGDR